MANESNDAPLLEWEAKQHDALTGDPIWRLNCYREALYLVDRAGENLKQFVNQPEHAKARAQLISSVASIAANIGEGYGRSSIADRTRFFTYALGSAREAVLWYLVFRPTNDHAVIDDRVARLGRIRRMVLGLLGRVREKKGKKFDSW